MIYLKWLLFSLLDLCMLLTVPVAAPLIAAFTREDVYGRQRYTWGWLWGTYDNPPQGDEGFVEKRAWFPGITTGFKGYLNRVHWMLRNPLYGLARKLALPHVASDTLHTIGDLAVSDKYRIPGWYFARLYRGQRLVGFEFYGVFPWSQTRDLRVRLGWKLVTDKFAEYGFAQLVNTCNPFDGYGVDLR